MPSVFRSRKNFAKIFYLIIAFSSIIWYLLLGWERSIRMRKLVKAPVERELPDMNLYSFGEWLDADLSDPPEIVKGLVPATGCGFFAGTPKSGKTWAVIDLALAVITGQTFLGRKTEQLDRPVLYVAGEGGIVKLLRRVRWLARGRDIPYDLLRSTLHISSAPRIRLDRSDGMEALEESIKQLKPGLVIIDPLTRFHSVDENSQAVDPEILTPLRHISEEYDLCVMVVHHSPKWTGGRFDPLRGSSAFAGWHDFLLYYEPIIAQSEESNGKNNGKNNGKGSDGGGDVTGYKFAATLRDNEEPAKREVLLEITPDMEKCRIRLSYHEANETLFDLPTLENRILHILKQEYAVSRNKIRIVLKRNKDQVNSSVDALIKSGKIEEFIEDNFKKLRIKVYKSE